jgi:Tol biopolymer transport system component
MRWGVPAAIGILAVVFGVLFIRYSPILNPPNPFVEAATGITVREVLPGGWGVSPSRDGRFFAFVDWSTGNIAIRNLETGERKQLTDEASYGDPAEYALWSAISPDGNLIAYTWWFEGDRTELRLVGRDGSNPRTILGAEAGFYHETVSWSSNGEHIAIRKFDKPDQLVWVSADDGSVRVLANLGTGNWTGKVFHSPDDRYLAYSHISKKYPQNYDVYLVVTDGSGQTTALVEHPANERVLGWIPGRNAIVFLSDRSGTWDVWLLEISDGQPKADPRRVYTNVGNVNPIGFTDDGSFYYLVHSRWVNNYVTILNPQTGKLVGELTQPLVGYNTALDWSPDGRYLAYSPVGTAPAGIAILQGSLCIRDLQTGEDRTVPCDLRGIFAVRWSPDGSTLLVSGSRYGEVYSRPKSELFSVNRQTGATRLLVERPNQRIIAGDWALDGSGFYFVDGPDGPSLRTEYDGWDSVVFHNLDSGRERKLYENPGLTGYLALCPRGERLAVGLDDPERGASLMVIDVSSGAARQLLKLAEPGSIRGHFDWSSDGRHVYYMKGEDKTGTSLWRIGTQGGGPERLWQTEKRVGSPRIHPAGKQITFDELTDETATWVMEGFIPGPMASK